MSPKNSFHIKASADSQSTPLTEFRVLGPIDNMAQDRLAKLAYSYWEARGRPFGSPEEDWFKAVRVLERMRAAQC